MSKANKERVVRYPTASNALRVFLEETRRGDAGVKATTTRLASRLLDRQPSVSNRMVSPAVKPRGLVLKTRPAPHRPSATPGPQVSRIQGDLGAVADVVALGRMVRLRRRILELTQQQLADRANVGRRFVCELEAGKPTLELGKVLAVCRSIDLTLYASFSDGG